MGAALHRRAPSDIHGKISRDRPLESLGIDAGIATTWEASDSRPASPPGPLLSRCSCNGTTARRSPCTPSPLAPGRLLHRRRRRRSDCGTSRPGRIGPHPGCAGESPTGGASWTHPIRDWAPIVPVNNLPAKRQPPAPEVHHLPKPFIPKSVPPGQRLAFVHAQYLPFDEYLGAGPACATGRMDLDVLHLHTGPPPQQVHRLLACVSIAVADFPDTYSALPRGPDGMSLRSVHDVGFESLLKS